MATFGKSYNSQSNLGMMLPTTNVWDVSQIYSIDEIPSELKELLVRLYQNINNISLAVNLKNTGYYVQQEFLTGQLYFPNPNNSSSLNTNLLYRPVFRMTVDFGELPDTGTKQIPHYIDVNASYSITDIYGSATRRTPFTWIPLSYSSATLIDNIELWADDTYVNIKTAKDYSDFTISSVVLEYIKN